MNVRITRLMSDHERIVEMLRHTDRIRILDTVGDPPERYEFEYKVNSLTKNPKTGAIVKDDTFRVELTLTEAYPRLAPQCRLITPVFHPNIGTDAVCVTDYWSAGSSLSRLLVRIAELLGFQSYGLKFPLNPEAATWVERHLNELPTDGTDFVSILHASEGVMRHDDSDIRPTDACVSCGATAAQVTLHVTDSHHLVCDECRMLCHHCGLIMSVKSPREQCEVCEEWVCYSCIHRCLACGKLVCFDHMVKCGICELGHCPDCIGKCHDCGIDVCVEHAAPAERDGEQVNLCSNCLLQES